MWRVGDQYRHPDDPESRANRNRNRDRNRGRGGRDGRGRQRTPRRPRRQLPDDLGQLHTPADVQSNMLYEALRASRCNVNNGDVIDALFPDQRR